MREMVMGVLLIVFVLAFRSTCKGLMAYGLARWDARKAKPAPEDVAPAFPPGPWYQPDHDRVDLSLVEDMRFLEMTHSEVLHGPSKIPAQPVTAAQPGCTCQECVAFRNYQW